MARKLIAKLPGKTNINDQFTTGNLARTRALLRKLLKDGGGDYLFGSLTAAYFGYAPGSADYNRWMKVLADDYDQPARDKIKNTVIAAVDQSPPLPITFDWDRTGSPADVIVTRHSSPPSYSIKIVGYPEPLKSALADRKKKTYKK
jgi:hypothetical protein